MKHSIIIHHALQTIRIFSSLIKIGFLLIRRASYFSQRGLNIFDVILSTLSCRRKQKLEKLLKVLRVWRPSVLPPSLSFFHRCDNNDNEIAKFIEASSFTALLLRNPVTLNLLSAMNFRRRVLSHRALRFHLLITYLILLFLSSWASSGILSFSLEVALGGCV